MPELWESADLIELQQDNRVAPPDGFWLQFYPRVVTSDRERIYFDDLPVRDRRLAPFVAPNVQGRVMRMLGHTMSSFKPAYVKPKHAVDPSMAIPRMPGEPFGGNLTLDQRFDRVVARNMQTERDLIERRWDWLGAMAAIYASVTIAGEDYPSVTVNFNRDASLTYTLGAGARWNEGTATVLDDIRVARTNAFTLGGAPVSRVIFGVDAWTEFSAKPEVKDLLDSQNRGNNSLFNNVNLGADSPAEYLGRIAGPNGGQIDMWLYSNTYEDEDGATQQYLDPRDVVGIGNNFQGVRAFGAIMDKRAGLRPATIFPKMWEQEDPSVVYTMSQSAPLMVPGQPNNSFRIRALA